MTLLRSWPLTHMRGDALSGALAMTTPSSLPSPPKERGELLIRQTGVVVRVHRIDLARRIGAFLDIGALRRRLGHRFFHGLVDLRRRLLADLIEGGWIDEPGREQAVLELRDAIGFFAARPPAPGRMAVQE